MINETIKSEIRQRLAAIEGKHSVRILFAVETGSRAWGFPSPDSDYDVRFIYAHEAAWYLAIDTRRDVIELPIKDDLDINGWDIRKALQLLLKPNPVLLEWLASPVFYRQDEAFVAKLEALADRTLHAKAARYHYLSLGRSQFRKYVDGKKKVRLKKYFYVLRPALALMWLRENEGAHVPMTMAELRSGIQLPGAINTFLDDLLEKKKRTRELGTGPRNAALDALIQKVFAEAGQMGDEPYRPDPSLVDDANILFREAVGL